MNETAKTSPTSSFRTSSGSPARSSSSSRSSSRSSPGSRAPISTVALTVATAFAFFTARLPAAAQYAQTEVGVPNFHFRDGSSHSAGKCFAIRWHQRSFLITALHLLSPAGGYQRTVPQNQVEQLVESVDFMDPSGQQVLDTARHSLLKTNAPYYANTARITGDMLAFELPPHPRVWALSFYPTLAPKGTRVWIASHDEHSQSQQADSFSGTIIQSSPAFLLVQLMHPLTALASSGSPLVDQRHQLVGMLVGTQDAARTLIMATPSTALAARLAQEVGQ